MPILRITAQGDGAQEPVPGSKDEWRPKADGAAKEYDLELTQEQWHRYVKARTEGRMHLTTDEKRGLFVMTEQVKKGGEFDTSQLQPGAEIVEQGRVIAMGRMEPAKGDVNNKTGKRTL